MSAYVKLEWYEYYAAACVGILRYLESRRRDLKHAAFDPEHPVENDVEGACGESAFCKHFDIHWPASINTGSAPDVPPNLDIKTTFHSNGHLILYSDAVPDRKYVLVRGCQGKYEIVGWAYGVDGMLPEYWREDCKQPAYWIPASALQPLETLFENGALMRA